MSYPRAMVPVTPETLKVLDKVLKIMPAVYAGCWPKDCPCHMHDTRRALQAHRDTVAAELRRIGG